MPDDEFIDKNAKVLTDDFAPVESLQAIEHHNRKWWNSMNRLAIFISIYVNAFVIGIILMGFEMLGSLSFVSVFWRRDRDMVGPDLDGTLRPGSRVFCRWLSFG